MALRDELVADMAAAVAVRCATCKWLSSRPDAEREEFEGEMADKSFTDMVFVRAIAKRKGKVTPESVSKHRREHLA